MALRTQSACTNLNYDSDCPAADGLTIIKFIYLICKIACTLTAWTLHSIGYQSHCIENKILLMKISGQSLLNDLLIIRDCYGD